MPNATDDVHLEKVGFVRQPGSAVRIRQTFCEKVPTWVLA